MIKDLFGGMVVIMLAKIMFNDVPHYLFEDTTMRELKVTRVDERDPTPAQLRLIAIKSARLKIPEPVVKSFGEAGRMIQELKAEEQYRKRLKGGGNPGNPGNPTTPTGTCYPDAWRYLMLHGEGLLVHGSLKLSAEGKRVNHAWVELPSGWIYEPQTGRHFLVADFNMFEPVIDDSYTNEQAAIMVARVGKHGPWTAEERMEYLGR